LQLKIQYHAIISKNWIRLDVMKNDLVVKPSLRFIKRTYSDYPKFRIKVESVEEIFCAKIRTVIERKKCRDYFDLWKLTKLSIDLDKTKRILKEKLKIKGVEFTSLNQIFPKDLNETLLPYWERELGRLVYPLSDLDSVLREISNIMKINFLN